MNAASSKSTLILLHLSPDPSSTLRLSQLIGEPELQNWDGNGLPEICERVGSRFLIVIDAHANFTRLSDFFSKQLPSLPTSKANWQAAIIFVSDTWDTPTPPLDAISDLSTSEASSSGPSIIRLRKNQFFIRMVSSYGWGTFCHANRFKHYVSRINNNDDRPSPFLRLSPLEVEEWDADISRIWEVVEEKGKRGAWIEMPAEYFTHKMARKDVFPGLTRDTVLKSLAIIHQFGRVDQTESEKSMSESGIDWMKVRPPLPPMCREVINSRTLTAMTLFIPELRKFNPSILSFIQSATQTHHSATASVNNALVMNAGSRNLWRAKQVLFDLLMDMSQILAKGCASWAVRSLSRNGEGSPARPLKVLAIKDYVRDQIERKRLEESFSHAFYAAFRRDTVELHCVQYRPDATAAKQNVGWDTHEWWLKHLISKAKVDAAVHQTDRLIPGKTVVVDNGALHGESSESESSPGHTTLTDYDIILIEAEYETRFAGSSIIQWLDNAFDELRQATHGTALKKRPQIFVLSRDENAGHSFMCLWLGAQAFASKSRIHSIPSLLSMANVGIWGTTPDSKKRRPNFFAIEGLLPHQRNRLQSRRPEHLVTGDEWDRHWISSLPKADLHYHMGTSISLAALASMAANTCGHVISDENRVSDSEAEGPIDELIKNVCKIVLLANLDWKRHNEGTLKPREKFEELWAVARFVLLPTDKDGAIVANTAPPFGAMEEVVNWLTRKDRPVREFEACSFLVTALRIFEIYVTLNGSPNGCHVHPPGTPQVGYIEMQTSFMSSVAESWTGVSLLAAMLEKVTSDEVAPEHSGGDGPGASVVKEASSGGNGLAGELCNSLAYLVARISQNWSDLFTRSTVISPGQSAVNQRYAVSYLSAAAMYAQKNAARAFLRIAEEFDRLVSSDQANKTWIHDALQKFKSRKAEFVYPADEKMIHVFEDDPINTVHRLTECLSLKDLVVLPSVDPSEQIIPGRVKNSRGDVSRTLARYLVGSGLLGAEHLQFPENILLAGIDVAKQNVNDNVVYSEVRCATTGYCQAGMNVFDATDLLCVSFDLGALLFGAWSPAERRLVARSKGIEDRLAKGWVRAPHRWVRANILLGAKRHKSAEISQVVNLVTGYLRRGQEVATFRSNIGEGLSHDVPGQWWQRCSVVGFDLSGDESKKIDDLQRQVEPLFDACASITIHAGEAMTAHSIWDAVHHLGAQRIGHGLRLRENEKLLEHCVRRGICMELCPISNSFTNVFFHPSVIFSHGDGPEGDHREFPFNHRHQYPINAFLRAGLDVCLNTDNRSLHEKDTLTDEYLYAAKLSGGLSRWDILRICKAAFKNAFVPKDQIAALLRHVEYEIYKIACEHSGENAFPSVEGIGGRSCMLTGCFRSTSPSSSRPLTCSSSPKRLTRRVFPRRPSASLHGVKKGAAGASERRSLCIRDPALPLDALLRPDRKITSAFLLLRGAIR